LTDADVSKSHKPPVPEPKERPSLFGTIHLPERSLTRRYLTARIGKAVFVTIAVLCGVALVTLLTQISEEAFVPEEEIEVDGVRYPTKTVAETQLAWKAETFNVDWAADDLRQERNNITIEASWIETHFEALNDDGERFTSRFGETVFDLEEDLERALCDEGVAPVTYKPIEPWMVGHLLPGNDQDGMAYNTGFSTRINIFYRATAPTPGMGDFWVNSNDESRWVWHGLRWESAQNSEFLEQLLEYVPTDNTAFDDGKLWVHYTPVEPIFRGAGDLWLNRTAIDEFSFETIEEATSYNRTAKQWEPIDLASIPPVLLEPQNTIEPFVPEFCTKQETSYYILTSGQVGTAVIGEFNHDDGYEIRATAESGVEHRISMTVAITNAGQNRATVSIVNNAFDTPHVELQPSSGLTSNWLFLQHRMNYTVTYVQVEGPPADARESSYQEIGGFALGSPLDWFQFKFINDDDLDNDGIVDVCDDDIDNDNDGNPVIGHPTLCPGVGRFDASLLPAGADATTELPVDEQTWIGANDDDGDGIHDDVRDRDIDGDGVPNLVQGQGFSASASFEGQNDVRNVPELWALTQEWAVVKCSESYKPNDPAYASFDCEQATGMIETPATSAQEWCDGVRYLDQLIWSDKCNIPERLESGADMYEERDPYLPLLALMGLIGMLALMRSPNAFLLRMRNVLVQLGVDEHPKEELTPWSWASFASELTGRLLNIVISVVIFLLFFGVFLTTFNEHQPTLLVPFSFTIGGAVSVMAGIAVISSVSRALGVRPEPRVPRADGLVDLGLLMFTGLMVFIALSWLLVEGWVIGAVMLLMLMSATKRLVLAALQLTRTDNIQFDRLKLVVRGRQGWMTGAMVALVIAMFTVPVSIHIPFVWSDFTSSEPYKAGLRAAFWGSVYVVGYTMLFAIPLSIGAAIWLEEYAPNNRLRRTIQALITNLAGVPAIVFGLFGLAMFLTDRGIGLGLGGTVMTAGMTMATMAMPTIVISSQEALRAVPPSLRNGAFGLGCTKWQVTKDHVLPHAMPGMMTGTILAMSRIMGEAAPLILVGAVASVFAEPDAFFYVSYQMAPSVDGLLAWFPGVEPYFQNMPLWADRGPFSSNPSEYVGPDTNDRGFYTVLPVQVYRWTDMPAIGFKVAAAGASLVLLATLVVVNSAAILLRAHFRRYSKT